MARKKGRAVEPEPIFASAASTRGVSDFGEIKKAMSARYLQPSAPHPAGRAVRAMAALSPASDRNVVGVGIGEKLVDGKSTGLLALKFLVKIKLPESQLPERDRLPDEVDGLPTDVEQVGVFRRLTRKKAPAKKRPRKPAPKPKPAPVMPDPRARIRPARPGCSIGFRDPGDQFVMAGTFGALVRDDAGDYILSNNHVLADEGQLAAGAPIFQPGLLDGGIVRDDQVAELTRFVALQAGALNKVDGAVARALRPDLVSRDILYIGPPAGLGTAAIDMVVHKFGRTTGYRAGRITSVDTDVSVGYDTGTFNFEGQIIVVGLNGQPFSDSGDSGSLILERSTQTAVGLLFAGSSTHTIANHIGDVLAALGVTLA